MTTEITPAATTAVKKTRLPLDYQNGLIYKLQCDDGAYYYGSTCSGLEKRLYAHKNIGAKNHPERRIYAHIVKIGWEHAKMILQEKYSCSSKMELLQREDHFIRAAKGDPLCLNSNCAFQTDEQKAETKKQYAEDNKEQLAEYSKQRYDENKEQLSEYYKQRYIDNKPAMVACKKAYYETNRVAILAKLKAKRDAEKLICRIE